MAYKKVSGSRTAEIKLDGSVYTVDFGCSYNYYAVRNDSDSTIYVSTTDKSCTPNNDGVVSIPSGGGYVHYNGFGGSPEIFISGTGGALVIAQDNSVCPFKRVQKGGDGNIKTEPLVLFEGMTDSYNFANGITGFDIINTVPGGGDVLIKINNNDPDFWENTVNVGLSKAFSLYAENGVNDLESKYVDSALFALNQKVDLTNYSYILADCFYYSDYSSSDYISGMGGAYFRIGEPDNYPQSHEKYDWEGNGWQNMHIKSNRTPITFFYDVSDISGLQKICFGVLHGTYHGSYTNILRIHKIILI